MRLRAALKRSTMCRGASWVGFVTLSIAVATLLGVPLCAAELPSSPFWQAMAASVDTSGPSMSADSPTASAYSRAAAARVESASPEAIETPPPTAYMPGPSMPPYWPTVPAFMGDPLGWIEPRRCLACQPWQAIYQGSNYGQSCLCGTPGGGLSFDGLFRAYYVNDQRVQWTGNEETFGVEGVLAPSWSYEDSGMSVATNGVFFLNQPFDRNLLKFPAGTSYEPNFQIDPFQIWNLNVSIERGNWRLAFGKAPTPFGRYYAPLFSNNRSDAPFIRSEIIHWNEVGIFLRYTSGIFLADIAVTNGTQDRDTNSSKAGVVRLGMQTPGFEAGASAKIQDGVGSEWQKYVNNYFGFDVLVNRGNWDVSAEVIYDEYGYRRPIDPNTITWGRSLYYRDIYVGRPGGKLTGLGYYVNVGRTWANLRIDLNYGDYFPTPLDNALVDTPHHRGLIKGTWRCARGLESFTSVMVENVRPVEPFRSGQSPITVLTGMQSYF